MRVRYLVLGALTVMAAGCGDALTNPFNHLHTYLTQENVSTSATYVPVASAQDTVVLQTIQPPVCGVATAASSFAGQQLTVTITLDARLALPCALVSGRVLYTATVVGMPGGAYLTMLDYQVITSTATTDSTVSTGTVSLP